MGLRRILSTAAALLPVPLLGMAFLGGAHTPSEAAVRAQEAQRKAVAVLSFDNNTGDEKYRNLGRGLASMMMSDLSAVEEIQLVEREKLEEVMKELELQQSGMVDPESAQTLGMFVGAEFLIMGGFMTAEPEMLLDTRITRVETAEVITTAEVRGPSTDLFDLQQRLADELLDGLAIVLTEDQRAQLRVQQEANRINDLNTILAFSRVVCLIDYGEYVDAFQEIQEVRKAAPGSAIVEATFRHLQRRAEVEARRTVENKVEEVLGGLLGRRKRAQSQPRQDPVPVC